MKGNQHLCQGVSQTGTEVISPQMFQSGFQTCTGILTMSRLPWNCIVEIFPLIFVFRDPLRYMRCSSILCSVRVSLDLSIYPTKCFEFDIWQVGLGWRLYDVHRTYLFIWILKQSPRQKDKRSPAFEYYLMVHISPNKTVNARPSTEVWEVGGAYRQQAPASSSPSSPASPWLCLVLADVSLFQASGNGVFYVKCSDLEVGWGPIYLGRNNKIVR